MLFYLRLLQRLLWWVNGHIERPGQFQIHFSLSFFFAKMAEFASLCPSPVASPHWRPTLLRVSLYICSCWLAPPKFHQKSNYCQKRQKNNYYVRKKPVNNAFVKKALTGLTFKRFLLDFNWFHGKKLFISRLLFSWLCCIDLMRFLREDETLF